jgi:hypothetical protein
MTVFNIFCGRDDVFSIDECSFIYEKRMEWMPENKRNVARLLNPIYRRNHHARTY